MEWKYWKVVLRYGHVGKRNEVSVARFLVTEASCNVIMVMDLAAGMPGVKDSGVIGVKEVTVTDYLVGKREETENFYLKRLGIFTHKSA